MSQINVLSASRSSGAWATNKMYTILEIQNCKWFFMLCAPLLLLLLSSFRFCLSCTQSQWAGAAIFKLFPHDTRRQCLTSKMHSPISLESSVVQAKCQPAFRWILKVLCVVRSLRIYSPTLNSKILFAIWTLPMGQTQTVKLCKQYVSAVRVCTTRRIGMANG